MSAEPSAASAVSSDPTPLAGHDVLCLSSIDWDFLWQGHQQVMSALAAQGSRVLFVENTGVRPPRLGDLPRLRHRLENWKRGVRGFRQEAESLFVYSPVILPFPYSRLARGVNRWLLTRALRRWMRAARFGRPMLWTFLPTPLTLDLIEEFEPEAVVYYCVDDLPHSSPSARPVEVSERQLFERADLVFVTSERLRERAARSSRHVHLFPFGVDFERFEQARNDPAAVPPALGDLPRPVVGYVGGVHRWVDQELLVAVARAVPEACFAVVGPLQTEVTRLAAVPNVRLVGARPRDEIPGCIKAFDVGIIPYRLDDYTANVYPTKLNEYLALGLPVVATDLPEIRRFNLEHGDLVAACPDAATFAAAVRAALDDREPAVVARRIAVARTNGWTERIAAMSRLVRGVLDTRTGVERTWADRLRQVYRHARRRAGVTAALVLGVYLLLFHSPLLWLAARPLQVSVRPRRADAVVVFGGGTGETGRAGTGHEERVMQAVVFYRRGLARRLVFSTGAGFAFPEAEAMQALALHAGVPPDAIVIEQESANTHESALNCAEIAKREGFRRVLLVSSPYHMRRALGAMRVAAPDLAVLATPVVRSQFYSHGHGASLAQIVGILREYAALAWYWWNGWV